MRTLNARSRRSVGMLVAAALLIPIAASPVPSVAAVGDTNAISVIGSGATANGASGAGAGAVAADNRTVAFVSLASNLVPGDGNGVADAFVHDRVSKATTRVSVSSSGGEANGPASFAAISANGRYVFFVSSASNLVASDTNGVDDLFRYDRTTGQTIRVSVADGTGSQANGPVSGTPAVSGTGDAVAFTSSASNVVPGDTNGVADVFVWRSDNSVVRASVSSSGAQAATAAEAPSISRDGTIVAFNTTAALVSSDTQSPALADVYVRDLAAATTERVSVGQGATQGNGASEAASLSGDGRYVAFTSAASTLVPGDTNGVADVFVRDRLLAGTSRVSVDSVGAPANGASGPATISQDGRLVAFVSAASSLVPGDLNGVADAFVRDLVRGTTTRVSVSGAGAEADGASFGFPALSPDASLVAFNTSASNLVPGDSNATNDVVVNELPPAEPADALRLASVSASDGRADAASPVAGLSADGRYAVFESAATTLVNGDTNGVSDVFVRDLRSGFVERVSVSGAGAQGNGRSGEPSISADGRYVAFFSAASNLVPNDTNGPGDTGDDVFVRDRVAGTTTRVSVNSLGLQVIGASRSPKISADGRYVVFHSAAVDLTSVDINSALDVFRYDRVTGQTIMVSLSGAGQQGNGDSSFATVSSDGNVVAFQSAASTLVAGDTNSASDVFVRTISTGQTVRASVASAGVQGAGGSATSAALAAGGRFVAFQSSFTNLAAGDTNGVADVFVRDLQSPSTVRASVDSSGAQATGASALQAQPQLSSDGRFLAFESAASNLVAGDANGVTDVFVRDLTAATTMRASQSPAGAGGNAQSQFPAISSDGRIVSFASDASNLVPGDVNGVRDVFVLARFDEATSPVSRTTGGGFVAEPSSSGRRVVSGDGRYVAFTSASPALVPQDTNGVSDVFVHDRITGVTRRVSVSTAGVQATLPSQEPAISRDGRFVAFSSAASELVAGDTNGVRDVFRADLLTGDVRRVSMPAGGAQPNGDASAPTISADGRLVAFESNATNTPLDTNVFADVLVADASTGVVTLASADPAGAAGNGASTRPWIAGDGSSVAFVSAASNLVAKDTNGVADAFVRDLASSKTSRPSVATSGAQADGETTAVSLSGDGRFAALSSSASNLAPGASGSPSVFLRDRLAGTTELASAATSGEAAAGASTEAVVSADGRFVAFLSAATNLDPADASGDTDVFVRDMVLSKTRLASATSWGAKAAAASAAPSISSDGAVVAFESAAANLGGYDTNGATDVFAKRLQWTPAPPPITISNLAIAVQQPSIAAGVPSIKVADVSSARVVSLVDDALRSAPLGSIPLGSIPLLGPIGSLPLGSIPLGSIPLGSIPLGSIALEASPLGSIALDNVLLSSLDVDFVALLAGSSLEGIAPQTITLRRALADSVVGPRLRALTIKGAGLADSLLRGVQVASLLLGGAKLNQITLPGGLSICDALAQVGYSCAAGGVNAANDTILGLDIAGAPLGSIPLGSIPLGSIPLGSIPLGSIPLGSIDVLVTPLGSIPLSSLANPNAVVDCSRVNCSTQTLGDAAKLVPTAIRSGATLADLGSAAAQITLGQVLIGLLARSDYPWERLPVDGLQDDGNGPSLDYRVDFDFNCPAFNPSTLVTVTAPPGFRYVPGSSRFTFGAGSSQPAADPVVAGRAMTWSALPSNPCAGVAGEIQHVRMSYKARPGFTIGDFSAKVDVAVFRALASATGATVHVTEQGEPNNDAATAPVLQADTLAFGHIAELGDIDLFRVPIPAAGTKTRFLLSHIGEGADFDLTVFKPAAPTLQSSPLGSIPLGSIPMEDDGADLSGTAPPQQPETLRDIPLGSIPLGSIAIGSISQNRGSSDETAQIVSSGQAGYYTVAVTGFNGTRSADAYMLRVQNLGGAALPPCPPRTFPFDADPYAGADEAATHGTLPASVAPDRKSLFLVAQNRMSDLYGAAKTNEMLTSLGTLAARPEVAGAVLTVDSDQGVSDAFAAWDASPCSVDAANGVVRAVNTVVARYRPALTALRDVVLVGSDEALAMARVPDMTSLSNQSDYVPSLAFTTRNGTKGNATYAAALLGQVLTNDAYGTFTRTPWLDRELYLPDVAVSRLVETPDEIKGQIAQYIAANGILSPQSALSSGYDFIADGASSIADGIDDVLSAGKKTDRLISETWNKNDLLSMFVRDVISPNAHYDHYRAQPAVASSASDLVTTADGVFGVDPVLGSQLAKRLVFTIGCNSGQNVPDTILSNPTDVEKALLRDWAQTYSQVKAAVYIANTGFGYGDTERVALSERLMSAFASRLKDGWTTIGEKFVQAKHAYFDTAGGIYGVYDEKVLLEAQMYGLGFWRVGPATSAPPAPAPPSTTTDPVTGLPVATISLSPSLTRVESVRGTMWTGQSGLHVMHHRPVEPLVTKDVTIPGMTAHGVMITALQTRDEVGIDPVLGRPTIDLGSHEPERIVRDVVYPANLATVTRSRAFGSERATLNLIAGQFHSDGGFTGRGRQMLVTGFTGKVAYSSSTDFVSPEVPLVSVLQIANAVRVVVDASDNAGVVKRVAVLARHGSDGSWQFVELAQIPGTTRWTADIATLTAAESVEVSAMAQDAAGNVGYANKKGVLHKTALDIDGPAIFLDSPLDGAVYEVRQDVRASYRCTDPSGVSSCVGTLPNGAPLDTTTTGTKTFTVTAEDAMGHTSKRTVTYSVGYEFQGFYSPTVNYPGISEMTAGSTLPVKWSLKDASGAYVRNPAVVKSVGSQTISCTSRPSSIVQNEGSAGPGLVVYELTAEQFRYEWKTSESWVGTCRRLFITFDDGSRRFLDAKLK